MGKNGGYDTVYYWAGGTEVGAWHRTYGDDLEALVERIERGGRVAKLGRLDIGPPEGPPDAEDFRRIDFYRGEVL